MKAIELHCPHCGESLAGCWPPPEPQPSRGQLAYELRKCGMSWPQVAIAMAYPRRGGAGTARTAAFEYATSRKLEWPLGATLSHNT